MASIKRFEELIELNNYEKAIDELIDILRLIDGNFGSLSGLEVDNVPQQIKISPDNVDFNVFVCTRIANAIEALFTKEDFNLTVEGTLILLNYQRWLANIFAISPYYNADHILRRYNVGTEENFQLPPTLEAFLKFAILYLPDSNIEINLDAMWNVAPKVTIALCFALQTSRFIATEPAFSKRNVILQWLPEKLAQADFNDLPNGVSHDVYMHCSYDIAPDKHLVKKALNYSIRNYLLAKGWQDVKTKNIGIKNGKPIMLVSLEHFNNGHSIYRTHSTSIIAAREKFYIYGYGTKEVDAAGRAVFDEFIERKSSNLFESLKEIRNICEKNEVSVLYMPSIGMDLTNIFISNTRMAPIQAVALGHPATTHSEFIDYVIVEDDYVGDEKCFSEQLIRLPKDALPYVPSAQAPTAVEYNLRENPEIIQIGIAATTMKLNPYFLKALVEINNRSSKRLLFHFCIGQAHGIVYPYVKRFIKYYLGENAVVYQQQPYINYMRTLHQCDLMLNPFPFGNTNGIIDMITLGLVGICKTGPEVHEHIDEALFARLGLPNWLVAETADEYVENALRLIENNAERLELRRHIIENNRLNSLFTGNPKPLGEELFKLVEALPIFKTEEKKLSVAKKEKKNSDNKIAKKTTKKKSNKKV